MKSTVLYATAAVAAVLVPAALAGALGNSAGFADPTGDAGTAPDYSVVSVTNDDVGSLSFRVTFANRTTFDADDFTGLVIDADEDASTGSPHGNDRVFEVTADGAQILEYAADGWSPMSPQPPFTFAWEPDGYTLGIDRRDLGATSGFTFYGMSWDTEEDEPYDATPDGESVWRYSLRLPFGLTVAPSLPPFDVSDETPRAGKAFTLAMRVRRDDTGATLHEGRIGCSGRVAGGKPLPVAGNRFFLMTIAGVSDRTQASCVWNVPKAARGRRLTATITVAYGGKSVSRTQTAVVR
jgi:hypothetical protein